MTGERTTGRRHPVGWGMRGGASVPLVACDRPVVCGRCTRTMPAGEAFVETAPRRVGKAAPAACLACARVAPPPW